MSDLAPKKGQLTAFERWELPSFDTTPVRTQVSVSPETVIANAQAAAAELLRIKQQAHGEGYAAGQQAGHHAGYEEGRQLAVAEAEKMQNLMLNLQDALTRTDEALAQSLLDLSLEIAQKMVMTALQTKPELILKVVSSAISTLPHFNQNAHLILNPVDAELVRKHMGEELAHAGWKIFTDPKIESGGCRLETAHSNIDASNPTRWHNIVESIGQHKSWLMS